MLGHLVGAYLEPLGLLITAALVLAGCSASVTLDASEWTCAERGEVQEMVLMPVGKTAMQMPMSSVQCIRWERLDAQHASRPGH